VAMKDIAKSDRRTPGTMEILSTCIFLGALAVQAVSQPAVQSSQPSPPLKAEPAAIAADAPQYRVLPKRERSYYELIWGVDAMRAKAVESGELIKFSYRVIDADKAKPLNDKTIEPCLLDKAANVKLVIPSLEKVGQLRQASTPEAGKIYWMAFSNPGSVVKRGDRVTVVIGNFHIDGLVVE